MVEIAQRIQEIRHQIPNSVRLIAVTKNVTSAAVRAAYAAGIRDFAENRLQDALPKQKELQDLQDICWHYIGHLQTNKARKVLENFTWIHSIDSLKLAQNLDRMAEELQLTPQTCLQVKILPDPDKYGWHPPDLIADLPQLDRLSHIQIVGLMAILPLGLSLEHSLAAFQNVARLSSQIREQNLDQIQMKELSMGMSGDYLQAIAVGATAIRLGTTIFGG
jgi:PLP dependent protein